MQPKYYGAAAQYNKPVGSPIGNILKIVGIVVGALVLITIGFYLYNSLTSAGQNSAATLVARQKQLVAFINDNQKKIISDNLATVNTNALSLTTSDSYALQQGLKNSYGMTEIPESITAGEVDTTSNKTLDTAKQQSQFDKVYAQILTQKINSAKTLAQEVTGSSSGSMKTATQTAITHYNSILDALSKLSL